MKKLLVFCRHNSLRSNIFTSPATLDTLIKTIPKFKIEDNIPIQDIPHFEKCIREKDDNWYRDIAEVINNVAMAIDNVNGLEIKKRAMSYVSNLIETINIFTKDELAKLQAIDNLNLNIADVYQLESDIESNLRAIQRTLRKIK